MASTVNTTTTTGTSTTGPGNGAPRGPGPGPGTLTGMAAVELVFHFAPTTADVLRAATACRRWRALACADSVWRAKFRREKLLEKARLFEVALPPVPGRQAGAAAAAAAEDEDEAAGVGLAFYACVFALKVAQRLAVLLRAAHVSHHHHRSTPSHFPPPPPPPPLCRGTR